ncbi:hypothetical protein GCM10027360_68880 [Amycolatopsis echigonensis]
MLFRRIARRLAATFRMGVAWGTPKLIVLTVRGCLSRRERCLDKHPRTAGRLRIGVRGRVWVLGWLGARVRLEGREGNPEGI